MFSIEKDLSTEFPFIKRCCARFYRDSDERELLFSEVIERVWMKRDKFHGSIDDFRAWVFIITKNTYINHCRLNKKRQLVPIDTFDKIDESSPDFEQADLLGSCISLIENRFKHKQKYISVFRYHLIDGNTIEDTAQFVKIPSGSVKNIVFTIRKELNKRYSLRSYLN